MVSPCQRSITHDSQPCTTFSGGVCPHVVQGRRTPHVSSERLALQSLQQNMFCPVLLFCACSVGCRTAEQARALYYSRGGGGRIVLYKAVEHTPRFECKSASPYSRVRAYTRACPPPSEGGSDIWHPPPPPPGVGVKTVALSQRWQAFSLPPKGCEMGVKGCELPLSMRSLMRVYILLQRSDHRGIWSSRKASSGSCHFTGFTPFGADISHPPREISRGVHPGGEHMH